MIKLWKVMIQVRKWPQTYHEYAGIKPIWNVFQMMSKLFAADRYEVNPKVWTVKQLML